MKFLYEKFWIPFFGSILSKFVFLIEGDKHNIKKKVNVGPRIDGFIEIIDGLNSFDLVVYEGINKIKDGTLVKIK